MGQIIRAFRTAPCHQLPLSQTVIAEWAGIVQSQLSRIERGSPIHDLTRLRWWATLLHMPRELWWFTPAPPRSQTNNTDDSSLTEINSPRLTIERVNEALSTLAQAFSSLTHITAAGANTPPSVHGTLPDKTLAIPN